MERSQIVFSEDKMTNLKEKLQPTDLVYHCRRKGAKNNWKSYELSNFTAVASLLKIYPEVVKKTVLPEQLLKNHNVTFLTVERNTRQPYNENFCLFRTLAVHLHDNEKMEEEETAKLLIIFSLRAKKGISQNVKVFK